MTEATEHTQNPIQNKKLKKKKKNQSFPNGRRNGSSVEEQMEAVLSPLLVLYEGDWACILQL